MNGSTAGMVMAKVREGLAVPAGVSGSRSPPKAPCSRHTAPRCGVQCFLHAVSFDHTVGPRVGAHTLLAFYITTPGLRVPSRLLSSSELPQATVLIPLLRCSQANFSWTKELSLFSFGHPLPAPWPGPPHLGHQHPHVASTPERA